MRGVGYVHFAGASCTLPPAAPPQLLDLLGHRQLSALAYQVQCSATLDCADCLEDVTLWVTTFEEWLADAQSQDLVAM
eukprot:1389638-Alexandrium_andersonii.AAC.1